MRDILVAIQAGLRHLMAAQSVMEGEVGTIAGNLYFLSMFVVVMVASSIVSP